MFGTGMWKGLSTTFRKMFGERFTVQYPEHKLPLPVGFRGRVNLITDPETGKYRCTACGLCAKACPVGIIQITRAKDEKGKPTPYPGQFEYNLLECILCGLCVEACPFGSLTMTPERELAVYTRTQADQTTENLGVEDSPDTRAQQERVRGLGQMK